MNDDPVHIALNEVYLVATVGAVLFFSICMLLQ